MHEIQRAVEQPHVGHVCSTVKGQLGLVEDLLIPLLNGVFDGVSEPPRGNLGPDKRPSPVGRHQRDTNQ